MNDSILIEVSCALIQKDGCLLATRRSKQMPHALKWEFPGGKLLNGELPAESIIREIREELGIEIEVLEAMSAVNYQYPAHTVKLLPFICELKGGEIRLTEHQEFLWVDCKALDQLDWLEADVEVLRQFKSRYCP